MSRPRTYDEKRVGYAVRLPPELHARLKAASEERDLSMNLLIEKAIKRYLDSLPPKP